MAANSITFWLEAIVQIVIQTPNLAWIFPRGYIIRKQNVSHLNSKMAAKSITLWLEAIVQIVIQTPNLAWIFPEGYIIRKKMLATWKSKMATIFKDGRQFKNVLTWIWHRYPTLIILVLILMLFTMLKTMPLFLNASQSNKPLNNSRWPPMSQ